MNISKPSLKFLLGVLLVFVIPLTLSALTITRDFKSGGDATASHSLIDIDDSIQATTDRSYSTPSTFDEPTISIVFDDGWSSIYTNAFPILEEFGIDSTQFVLSSTFQDPNYMTVAQIKHMQQFGHEIQSHTITHSNLTEIPANKLFAELYESRTAIEQISGAPVEDLAVPYGAYNETVQAVAKQWYRSLRTTLNGVNTLENFNPYELLSPTIDSTHTVTDIQRFIQEAKDSNGWLILTYHQLDESDSFYAVTPDEFRAHMQAVTGSGVGIAPYSSVLDGLMEQTQ